MYSRHEMKARVLLRLQKGEPMSTEQLAKDLRAAYSSTREALMELKATKEVCIVKWTKTGAHPIRFWGLGTKDAPKPKPMNIEERNQNRQERRRALTEVNKTPPSKPRRDIAASWF